MLKENILFFLVLEHRLEEDPDNSYDSESHHSAGDFEDDPGCDYDYDSTSDDEPSDYSDDSSSDDSSDDSSSDEENLG